MQLSSEQQKAVEAQKAQCPFCKIVKGEIPSKKIYEDDKVLAILDINPAAKGHLLVLPKEHYPIMPLIPPEVFEYLFTKTKQLSAAMKEGLLLFGDTLFIANGYAAGQQSSHFMLHLVPRETNDGLDSFTPKKAVVDRQQAEEAFNLLKHNLPIMLRQRTALFPIPGMQQPAMESSAVSAPQSSSSFVSPNFSASPPASSASSQAAAILKRPTLGYTKESVIKLIESNEQLRELITNYPSQFKEQIDKNPRLKQAFASLDIDEIIAHFAPAAPVQSKYTLNELVTIVNDNPQLKDLLLKQTLQFAEAVSKIPELQEIFGGVDVEALERAVLAHDVHMEQDVQAMLGSFANKKTKQQQADDILSSPALKNLQPHLDVPESENPALIQEDDESLQEVEEVSKQQETEQQEESQDEEQQPEESSDERESQKVTASEKNKSEKQPEPEADDLISRLHKEMLRRKI